MTDGYLAANPEGMAKKSTHIDDLVSYTADIRAYHESGLSGLGTPWGDGDETARAFEEVYFPGHRNLTVLMEALETGFEQSTDQIKETATHFSRTESANTEEVRRLRTHG
ncbi:hypothetical protein [Streptomyces sp. x-80]|uniref:hypothetical protein n=1 Tax=Streptomyces sp. x-80 TaxID=2789282 RepID=UPI00398085C6